VWTKDAAVPVIVEKGQDLFLKHIICPPIQDHVVTAVLSLLRIERDGYVITRSAVSGCVEVLLQLNGGVEYATVYKRDLEPPILRETTAFYTAEGERLLQTCDASEYLRTVCGLHVPADYFLTPSLGGRKAQSRSFSRTSMFVTSNSQATGANIASHTAHTAPQRGTQEGWLGA